MRLSDILRKKSQQQPQQQPQESQQLENLDTKPQNPFLKKSVVEKLRQQNLLSLLKNSKEDIETTSTTKDVSETVSLDKIYGRAINSYREIFISLLNKKSGLSLEKIISLVKEIIELAVNKEDKFLLYCNYSTVDSYIYAHSVNVSILTSFLSVEKNLSQEEIFLTTLSAFLHDLGMVKVINLANKPQKLELSEYEEIKKHSLFIEEILTNFNIELSLKKKLVSIISSVHERTDGSGYPKSLKDKDIPIYSKIISITDIYEAMTHPRPYRKRILPHNVLVTLIQLAQTKLDTNLTKMFINRLSLFPIGSYVKLNTDEICQVCETNIGFPTRPKVKVILTAEKTLSKPTIIDLAKDSKIYVVEPVDDLSLDVADKKLLLQLKSQYWWVKKVE
jgi:HD-GYP domain-containing protein (c-di-GMP phosphodiesterase class II)